MGVGIEMGMGVGIQIGMEWGSGRDVFTILCNYLRYGLVEAPKNAGIRCVTGSK